MSNEVPKDEAWKNNRCREAATMRLSQWSCDNPQTPTALQFLSEKGQLMPVIEGALPTLKQALELNPEQGLNRNVVDNTLSRVIHDKMLGSLVTDDFGAVKFKPWTKAKTE